MSKQSKDFIIDFETLDDHSTGKILGVGVLAFSFEDECTFDDYIEQALFVKFKVSEQTNRTVNTETLNFWKSQSPEAKEILKPSSWDVSIEDGLDIIRDYFTEHGYSNKNSNIWARRVHFDFPFLESMIREKNYPKFYNPWNLMCSYVMIKSLTLDPYGRYEIDGGTPSTFIAHNPVHDIALDALRIREVMEKAHG